MLNHGLLFQVYGEGAAWQFLGWILVFTCLVLANEFARRTKAGGMLCFVVLPIILTVYFIAIYVSAAAGTEWALNNNTYVHMTSWFHYAKLYAATAGCIGFMMLKYKWGIGKTQWFKAFPFVIVAINILIAVCSDFESAIRGAQALAETGTSRWLSSEGVWLYGGWWNVLNGLAGIINILCMTGWWGIYSSKDKKDMLDNHHVLNDLCHKMDPTRLTTLACYAMCGPFNRSAHITDLVGWNLYLGWYVPGFFLNDLFLRFFHLVFPNRPIGYSEYGAEGMPNLHSRRPRRGDHTEEYQARYHEYMLRCFERHPFMWSTYVWNMFDFAADARNQGGEPGMNHKGLVTFDRKTKKDSFFLYKAYWSDEPFVHLCGSRRSDRSEDTTTIKVYTNQPVVSLYNNGELIEQKSGDHIFTFQLPMEKENQIEAVAGSVRDAMVLRHTEKENPDYKLKKEAKKSENWV